MDDFFFAGGLMAQLKKISPFLHLDAKGVTNTQVSALDRKCRLLR